MAIKYPEIMPAKMSRIIAPEEPSGI